MDWGDREDFPRAVRHWLFSWLIAALIVLGLAAADGLLERWIR